MVITASNSFTSSNSPRNSGSSQDRSWFEGSLAKDPLVHDFIAPQVSVPCVETEGAPGPALRLVVDNVVAENVVDRSGHTERSRERPSSFAPWSAVSWSAVPRLAVPALAGASGSHSVRAAGAPRSSSPRVRSSSVYLKRRLAVATAMTLVVVLGCWLMGVSLVDFDVAGTNPSSVLVTYVVEPGDTYSSIAQKLGSNSTSDTARALETANAAAVLEPGQRLVVDPSATVGLEAPVG